MTFRDPASLLDLAARLEQLAELLRRENQTGWAEVIAKDAAVLRLGDWNGCTSYRSHFHKYGFGDCILGQGANVYDRRTGTWRLEGDETFLLFEQLRDSTYTRALQLAREFEPTLAESLSSGWCSAELRTKVMLFSVGALFVILIYQLISRAGD